MKKSFKRIISLILSVALLCCATLPVFAAEKEEYISELRLVYADSYNEANAIIAESEFKEYKIFKSNLNDGTGETGVWLAYKTSTDIEEAITDLAIMQMNGGYSDGNYQAIIKESYDEYTKMGEIYLGAIEYFVEAYEADDFLAKIAYRQLNFYNVVSTGIPDTEIPTFEGERLGDIFYNGITKYELATMFMQGNSYALDSIRSLIAMGVAYNEDGETYLDKVNAAAAEMNNDPFAFDGEDYDELASIIAPSIIAFRAMLEELDAMSDDLNFEDDELTDLELKYLESQAIADMTRAVDYLDGATLYDFCLKYELDTDDYSSLYPLVAALNDGQVAMTMVNHFYDVVRYSVPTFAEEVIEEQLAELEETYGEYPFNIYTGVDRTVYYSTFAITSEASRADAYTEDGGITEAFFGDANRGSTIGSIVMGVVGAGLVVGGVAAYSAAEQVVMEITAQATSQVAELTNFSLNFLATDTIFTEVNGVWADFTYDQLMNHYMAITMAKTGHFVDVTSMSFACKVAYVDWASQGEMVVILQRSDLANFHMISKEVAAAKQDVIQSTNDYISSVAPSGALPGLLFIAGGLAMLYSALNLAMTVVNYYNPEYDDIPIAMVDLVDTIDGDRYIKYDAVLNAETNDKGIYEAGDLNAYEAKRWNALYYTKSYEAGKSLLADSFSLSTSSSAVKDGYTPVHRFGEVVCYDLNKYNFDGDTNLYLSIKQSKNDKAAVAGVPEVVGSMVGTGFLFLAGGLGIAAGVGGTIATQKILNKKKQGATAEAEVKAEPEEPAEK